MTTIKLIDVFTKQQINQILRLNKQHADDIALTRALKEYFHTIGDQLNTKGLLPDYADYAVLYVLRMSGRKN